MALQTMIDSVPFCTPYSSCGLSVTQIWHFYLLTLPDNNKLHSLEKMNSRRYPESVEVFDRQY